MFFFVSNAFIVKQHKAETGKKLSKSEAWLMTMNKVNETENEK